MRKMAPEPRQLFLRPGGLEDRAALCCTVLNPSSAGRVPLRRVDYTLALTPALSPRGEGEALSAVPSGLGVI
jgi:hypothetical protein